MKSAVVPSSWLSLAKGWNAKNLIKMSEVVDAAGVDPHDMAAVQAACEAHDASAVAQARGLRKKLRELDQEKKELLTELDPLEPIMPVMHWDRIKRGDA